MLDTYVKMLQTIRANKYHNARTQANNVLGDNAFQIANENATQISIKQDELQ